jgi:L-threonylcarbamoyladenylate synthase
MAYSPTISSVELTQPTPEALLQAALHLKQGGLVALPTETVYGLGADAENPAAIAKIYSAKNRPSNHPLIVHLAETADVYHWAKDIPAYAQALMAKFWPGPMTLILPRTSNSKDFITGGQDSVGLRIPNHPVALSLLAGFRVLGGKGVAAPSANRYGAVSPTTAQAVRAELAQYLAPEDLILEGGTSAVGVESTIIDCTGPNPAILRPGAITASDIELCTGIVTTEPTETKVRVSGSHKQHYSPKAKVLTEGTALVGEGLIALSEIETPAGVTRLAEPKSVEEYARVLYSALRSADEQGIATIRVISPDGDGLAIAIRDRIHRSAAQG